MQYTQYQHIHNINTYTVNKPSDNLTLGMVVMLMRVKKSQNRRAEALVAWTEGTE